MGKKIKLFHQKYKTNVVLTDAGLNNNFCEDFFLDEKNKINKYRSIKIDSTNTHGTGCTFSSALAIYLSRGNSISESVLLSKRFTKKCIKMAPNFVNGYGPIGH